MSQKQTAPPVTAGSTETHAAPSPQRVGPLAVLVVAPVLFMTGSLIHPAEAKDGAAQLEIVAAASGRWTAAHVLLVAGAITMIFAVLALARLVGAAAPRLARIGTVLGVVGAPALVGLFAMEGFGALALSDGSGNATAGAALEALEAGVMPFALVSLSLFVGLCVLGVALARTRRAAVWAASTLVVAAAGFVVGLMAEIGPLLYATQVGMTVALAGIALTARNGVVR